MRLPTRADAATPIPNGIVFMTRDWMSTNTPKGMWRLTLVSRHDHGLSGQRKGTETAGGKCNDLESGPERWPSTYARSSGDGEDIPFRADHEDARNG